MHKRENFLKTAFVLFTNKHYTDTTLLVPLVTNVTKEYEVVREDDNGKIGIESTLVDAFPQDTNNINDVIGTTLLVLVVPNATKEYEVAAETDDGTVDTNVGIEITQMLG